MNFRCVHAAFPGSAHLWRAGERILRSRTFVRWNCQAKSTEMGKPVFARRKNRHARRARYPELRAALLLIPILFAATTRATPLQTPQQQIAARAGLEQMLGAQVPLDAVFRDEHGKNAPLGSYFGKKPVVLALAYYECPNLCTLVLNGILTTAQDLKLDAGKDYEIVVVSFDPHERPALAAAKKQIYIQRYGRPSYSYGWHFLTGDESSITRLADSVGYHFAWDASTSQFAHPSAIMILTPQGKVSRYFPGIEYPPREVRLALMAASDDQVGSLVDRVFLLCFHYNPATGKYGLLIWRVIQIAGCGTALLLALFVILNVRRERIFS